MIFSIVYVFALTEIVELGRSIYPTRNRERTKLPCPRISRIKIRKIRAKTITEPQIQRGFHFYSSTHLSILHAHLGHLLRTIRNPPRPQRQRLQLQRRRLDEAPERDDADDDTHDIHNIVPVSLDVADAATGNAAVFVCAGRAREGGGFGEKGTLEFIVENVAWSRRLAGGDGEVVDEFEDEEAREGTAEVGDAGSMINTG